MLNKTLKLTLLTLGLFATYAVWVSDDRTVHIISPELDIPNTTESEPSFPLYSTGGAPLHEPVPVAPDVSIEEPKAVKVPAHPTILKAVKPQSPLGSTETPETKSEEPTPKNENIQEPVYLDPKSDEAETPELKTPTAPPAAAPDQTSTKQEEVADPDSTSVEPAPEAEPNEPEELQSITPESPPTEEVPPSTEGQDDTFTPTTTISTPTTIKVTALMGTVSLSGEAFKFPGSYRSVEVSASKSAPIPFLEAMNPAVELGIILGVEQVTGEASATARYKTEPIVTKVTTESTHIKLGTPVAVGIEVYNNIQVKVGLKPSVLYSNGDKVDVSATFREETQTSRNRDDNLSYELSPTIALEQSNLTIGLTYVNQKPFVKTTTSAEMTGLVLSAGVRF